MYLFTYTYVCTFEPQMFILYIIFRTHKKITSHAVKKNKSNLESTSHNINMYINKYVCFQSCILLYCNPLQPISKYQNLFECVNTLSCAAANDVTSLTAEITLNSK